MLRFGADPILECSSKGDRRFSALYARIRFRGNRTIEELYQARKLILIDGQYISGLSVKEAKGKSCVNIEDARLFYRQLWAEYFHENPELYEVIRPYRGFSDVFGQVNHACQAEEIWLIHQKI